jgi:UDP-glucose 4-epimerase
MVSSIFVEQYRNDQALTVHGDGSQRRDFVHVYDVAEANRRAFERPGLGGGEVLNIGTGESHSIQELADLISTKQVHLPPRGFDMKETLADTSKTERMLEWRPSVGFVKGTLALKHGNGDFR